MWSLSDEALLAGMASGDPHAAAAFVRRYQARVYGLAKTLLGDKASAEEAAQEAFLKVWRNAGAYDARRGHVSTWLLTITRNVSVDAARLKRASPIDPDALAALIDQGTHREAIDASDARLEIHRLRGAIRALPNEQRTALLHAAFFGRTAREIGELEDVPIGTVKTRIRTALYKLRSALEVHDDI